MALRDRADDAPRPRRRARAPRRRAAPPRRGRGQALGARGGAWPPRRRGRGGGRAAASSSPQQLADMPGAAELEAGLEKAQGARRAGPAGRQRGPHPRADHAARGGAARPPPRRHRGRAPGLDASAAAARVGQIDEVERRRAEIEDEREQLRDAPASSSWTSAAEILSQIAEAEAARKAAGRPAGRSRAGAGRRRPASPGTALAALAAAREEKVRSESRLEAARDALLRGGPRRRGAAGGDAGPPRRSCAASRPAPSCRTRPRWSAASNRCAATASGSAP